MVGRLLLRALGRAERIHRAMVSRGFDGEVRILHDLSLRRADGLFAILFVIGAGLSLTFGHLLGGIG
jgi:cobalt/nickel transport system permease protein